MKDTTRNWLGFSAFMALAIVGACTLFGPVVEKIADGVEKYCEQPESYRIVYRNTVNSYLTESGHVVHVHCAGDENALTD